jgi:hypothetical protein
MCVSYMMSVGLMISFTLLTHKGFTHREEDETELLILEQQFVLHKLYGVKSKDRLRGVRPKKGPSHLP